MASRGRGDTELPPTLAAAVAYEAWQELSRPNIEIWLGPLVVADLLRSRGKARAHLPCVNVGLRAVPWEVRRQKGRKARLAAHLAALKAAAEWGLAECDRLAVARARLERRCPASGGQFPPAGVGGFGRGETLRDRRHRRR